MMPARAERLAVPERGIDQALLDEAVRAAVNTERCQRGLRPLAPAGGKLVESALAHSDWMARKGQLSHRGGARNRATLPQRVNWAGQVARRASENIAMTPRFRTGSQPFYVVDRGSCVFADAGARTIPPHSYASLARHTVKLWMESSGHRKNILDRKAERMSTAAAFSTSDICGRFWLTQIFVG